jgi:tRNA C32,U32 (ribose-2'-O)-methylase TrmJ
LYRQLEQDNPGAEYAHGPGAEYAHGPGAEYAHGPGAEYAHWDRRWATAGELEGFIQHLDRVLQRIDFYDETNKRQSLTRLRRLYTRLALDETEVQMLRGILSQMELAAGD